MTKNPLDKVFASGVSPQPMVKEKRLRDSLPVTVKRHAARSREILAVMLALSVVGVFSVWVLPAPEAFAQVDTARNKGLAWMMTHQRNDGSWVSTPGSEFIVTATAVDAFVNSGLKNFSYAQGVSWLANASAISVDSLARQMLALEQSKVNVASHFQRLLQTRNTNLTWGAYQGFETSFPDTALALSAIRTGGLSYTDTEVEMGLCRILQSQKTGDPTIAGSWSHIFPGVSPPTSAIGSAILPTTYNIIEIAAVQVAKGWTTRTCSGTQYTLQTAVDNGISWLLTQKKKADGGFGQESVSTVLDTALVYPVLYALRNSDSATSAALTYLISAQNTDGSWNGDVLQTAFVLKAFPPFGGTYTDTDKDGIPDAIETILGSNPNVADSRLLTSQSATGTPLPSDLTILSNSIPQTKPLVGGLSTGNGSGDINGDGVVDAADLAIGERIVLGLVIPTQAQKDRGDVAPAGSPNGLIDVDDLTRIRRKILGLEDF